MADDNVEQKSASILKPEVAEQDESAQLDEIKADEKDVKEFYKQFPDETLTAFTKVSSFARDVNVQLAGHEVLIVGKTNHGKSSLLEAIIGHPALIIKGTNRPINFIMINNPDCPQPRVTLKRDQYLDITEDVVVSVHDLHNEILKRNTKELNANPIQVKYEWQYAGNITYIDTPGIKMWDDSDERAKLAIELGRATHRTLLFVEESNDWDHVEVMDFAKKMDSGFARSFFVFTKFHEQVSKFSNQTELSQYFSKKPECKCFFLSLLNQPTRLASIQADKYPDRLYQAYRRDISDLEKLKFDRRDESFIGVSQVRTYLMEQIWKQYKEFIPELRKQLANMKKGSNDALKRIQDQMHGLDYNKLRSMSSNYVADWLQIVVNFIDGSSESSVALAGQSLSEESAFSDLGDWAYSDQVIYQVPQKDEKLYGGQQFSRMLNVFKAISNMNITITQADIEEAAAVHYGSKFNMSDCTAIASHIVQKKIRALYEPLIEHLTRRSKYIVKRLADIGFDVCQTRAALNVKRVASKGAWDDLTTMRGYPYFQSIVRDLFNDYIDKMGADFSQKCLDDIDCSKLIYWQISSSKYPNPTKRSIEELNKTVQAMATDLFQELKSSIGTSVLLKCHSTFLVNMPRNISGEILREVSSFDNNLMEEIFELKVVKGVLKEEEEKERQVLQSFTEQELVLKDLAAQFTRFKLVANAVLKFQAIAAFMKAANLTLKKN